MRPSTLFEVATQIIGGKEFNFAIKEFLDEIKFRKSKFIDLASTYRDEPATIGDPVQDVFLAGLAEMIAGESSVPEWAMKSNRFLAEPAFLGGKYSRHLVIQYTPIAMRNRLLFCGEILIG